MSEDIKFDEFVSKGWGYEKIIVNGPLYCGKILRFVKDRKCSLHYHMKKTETFHLLSGKLKVLWCNDSERMELIKKTGWDEVKQYKHSEHYREDAIMELCKEEILEPGDTFHLEPGLVHMMVALEDSDLLEISTQDFKDDSYRIIKGD